MVFYVNGALLISKLNFLECLQPDAVSWSYFLCISGCIFVTLSVGFQNSNDDKGNSKHDKHDKIEEQREQTDNVDWATKSVVGLLIISVYSTHAKLDKNSKPDFKLR